MVLRVQKSSNGLISSFVNPKFVCAYSFMSEQRLEPETAVFVYKSVKIIISVLGLIKNTLLRLAYSDFKCEVFGALILERMRKFLAKTKNVLQVSETLDSRARMNDELNNLWLVYIMFLKTFRIILQNIA